MSQLNRLDNCQISSSSNFLIVPILFLFDRIRFSIKNFFRNHSTVKSLWTEKSCFHYHSNKHDSVVPEGRLATLQSDAWNSKSWCTWLSLWAAISGKLSWRGDQIEITAWWKLLFQVKFFEQFFDMLLNIVFPIMWRINQASVILFP
jgi:hypothetical protein